MEQGKISPIIYAINSFTNDNPNSGIYETSVSKTLDLAGGNPNCNQGGMAICEQTTESISEWNQYDVRRLTPVECARLQGFPDDWCADIPHSDFAEYKLWGNGMALPCSLYIMEGIEELLKGEKHGKDI